ncbi:uncharacterized protein LOC133338048 [Musca vetustissima]|uniref:uncharacterized protein LOC133338048 n=1 Tax=Musca vetustissima TaxID=27455 RepID=UPI002AB781F7|nr:uncharacterized protein LOC133338048 [Musca vetustissima]
MRGINIKSWSSLDISKTRAMALHGLTKRLLIFFLVLHFDRNSCCNSEQWKIIKYFNEMEAIEMNVFIDINGQAESEFQDISMKSDIPKIIINSENVTRENLYKQFNMNILTVTRIDANNQNVTFSLMDELLWRRHYTKIIVVFESDDDVDEQQLVSLFQDSFKNGYLSVLVLWHNDTYTYTPYPQIRVIHLKNYMEFGELQKRRPHNFNKFHINIVVVEIPPRCFSIHNRQGELIRSGYFYKVVENFVRHHNGTLNPVFVDAWAISFDEASIVDLVNNRGFSFIPTYLTASKHYESSDCIHFGKCYLLVPAAREINQNVYLLVSFDRGMWFMVALLLVILTALIALINRFLFNKCDMIESIIYALQIIIFISGQVFEKKTFFFFMLHLLFLCIGLFLTNSYSGNLSSMYTSRIYEEELKTLQDVGRTNLGIHTYTLNYNTYFKLENLPDIIYQRFFTGNNTVFNINRKNLYIDNIYVGMDDTVDLLLYQQLYMKRPLVKYMPEPLYTLPMFVSMPHRLPFFEYFNRHLWYVTDSGLLNKFKVDSKWDAIVGRTITFFPDTPPIRAMSLSYLKYAFVMLFIGFYVGFLIFVGEILRAKLNVSRLRSNDLVEK